MSINYQSQDHVEANLIAQKEIEEFKENDINNFIPSKINEGSNHIVETDEEQYKVRREYELIDEISYALESEDQNNDEDEDDEINFTGMNFDPNTHGRNNGEPFDFFIEAPVNFNEDNILYQIRTYTNDWEINSSNPPVINHGLKIFEIEDDDLQINRGKAFKNIVESNLNEDEESTWIYVKVGNKIYQFSYNGIPHETEDDEDEDDVATESLDNNYGLYKVTIKVYKVNGNHPVKTLKTTVLKRHNY